MLAHLFCTATLDTAFRLDRASCFLVFFWTWLQGKCESCIFGTLPSSAFIFRLNSLRWNHKPIWVYSNARLQVLKRIVSIILISAASDYRVVFTVIALAWSLQFLVHLSSCFNRSTWFLNCRDDLSLRLNWLSSVETTLLTIGGHKVWSLWFFCISFNRARNWISVKMYRLADVVRLGVRLFRVGV